MGGGVVATMSKFVTEGADGKVKQVNQMTNALCFSHWFSIHLKNVLVMWTFWLMIYLNFNFGFCGKWLKG